MARRAPQKPPKRDLFQYDLALRLALEKALDLGAALQAVLGRSEPVDPQHAAIVMPAVLLPQEACARLLGDPLSPATLARRFDAWLAATDPHPIAAALVLYATAAHLRLPGLGAAGQRRILEAVEKFRKRFRIPEPELEARLADSAPPWAPLPLWLAAVSALADRLAELAAAPEQLRTSLDSALERQRELTQQNDALATRVAELEGRLERLRLHNHNLRAELARLRRIAEEQSTAAARAAELETRVQQLQDEVEELRALIEDGTFDFETGDAPRDESSAVAGPGPTLHHQSEAAPDLSSVYLVLLHSNDKDNTPMEVRSNLMARGVGHVDVQRIDEGRIPTSFPQGAIVAIDVSFMSHPVAEKAYANAVASGVPVFKFARLGPARLYRRLVRLLQERERHGMRER
jgi:regulator of replication initiation timing